MVRRAGLDAGAVVQAAVELLDSEGAAGLSMARLAERLGVKPPSLYKHLSGLDALQRGVALWGTRELGKRMARAAVGKSSDDALTAMATAYRAFVKEHPGVYMLTTRAPNPDDAELVEASQEIVSMTQDVLAPYGLDEATTIHTIRGFRALAHGFVSLEVAGGFGMPLDVDASFYHLVALFIRGLK